MGSVHLRNAGELAGCAQSTRALAGAPSPNSCVGRHDLSPAGLPNISYKRESRRFGDLGSELAEELRHALAHRRDLPPVWDPGRDPRDVIGAAQFCVQIRRQHHPRRRSRQAAAAEPPGARLQLPARRPNVAEDAVAAVVRGALERADLADGEARSRSRFPGAATLPCPPPCGRGRHLRRAAAHDRRADALVPCIDGDVGKSLGRIIRTRSRRGPT